MTIQEWALLREAILDTLDDGHIYGDEDSALRVRRAWRFYAEDDWRKDSTKSNKDRITFTDAVQHQLLKAIQSAEKEIHHVGSN